jgi:hypothetical protein
MLYYHALLIVYATGVIMPRPAGGNQACINAHRDTAHRTRLQAKLGLLSVYYFFKSLRLRMLSALMRAITDLFFSGHFSKVTLNWRHAHPLRSLIVGEAQGS